MTMNFDDYTTDQQTIEQAENLFDQATVENIHRKYGNQKTREACLKIAARQEQTILNNADELENFPGHAMQQKVRKIAKQLDSYAPHYGAEAHLEKYREHEDVTDEQIDRALELTEDTEGCEDLIGKKPSAKAGAALYAAGVITGDHLTKEEVLDLCGVSEPTLRKSYKTIVEELDLKDEILDNHPYPERTMWKQ